LLYIFSGLFGSIMSTIFAPDSVGVGASGAIFGLFGAAWGDLIQNWDLYDSPGSTMCSLFVGTV
jgi:membrane associated rhomboid family serine protease